MDLVRIGRELRLAWHRDGVGTPTSRQRRSSRERRDRDHTRHRPHCCQHLGYRQIGLDSRRGESGVVNREYTGVDAHGHDVTWLEPEVRRHHTHEAGDKQAGPDEQHDRQRNLDHHQTGPQALLRPTRCAPPATLTKCTVHIRPGQLPCRREATQHTGHHRGQCGRRQDSDVESDDCDTGDGRRHRGPQDRHAPACEQQAADTPKAREQDTFDKQATRQTPPAGAQCGADHQFA